jgi:uncharacterized protein YjbI with pentapeptide repeats
VESPEPPPPAARAGADRAPAALPAGDDPRARAVREVVAALRAGRATAREVDWSALRLIGADLAGLDLSGARLAGCDLGRADLRGSHLMGVDLAGASLFEADLEGAELTGADLRGARLEGADATRAGLGHARLEAAALGRATLAGATLTEARLAGADLRGADLSGARARAVDLSDADLTNARLSHADLDHARVAGASLDGADLRGASLAGLEGYRRASWLGVDLRDIDFTGAYLCRAFIMDQNFIQEFRSQSRWTGVLYQLWRLTSDCGRSVTRWAFCTLVLVFLYAWAFTLTGVDYGDHPTAISPLYYSVVTLTTLGYGDVVPASSAAQVVAMAEVVTGYVMLGGLLSIFSNKMASRAS